MIFSTLFEVGKTAAICFLLNDHFKNNHPDKYREFCIDIVFNILHLYTRCQILHNNSVSYLSEKMPVVTNFLTKLFKKNIKHSTIEFIKDTSVVGVVSKDILLKENNFKIPDHDFIIYRDTSNIKVLYNSDSEILAKDETYEYEKSDIKFLLIELIINDKTYIIELVSDKYNFYIKDNILNKNFFLYYLRYFHPDKIVFEDEIDNIMLKVIDHNVVVQTILFIKNTAKSLKIHKSDYEIVTKNYVKLDSN